jgi:hypothetical protein
MDRNSPLKLLIRKDPMGMWTTRFKGCPVGVYPNGANALAGIDDAKVVATQLLRSVVTEMVRRKREKATTTGNLPMHPSGHNTF